MKLISFASLVVVQVALSRLVDAFATAISIQKRFDTCVAASENDQESDVVVPNNDETSQSELRVGASLGVALRANRFSKFAPDANLPADIFRAQLRENMKADLEERRKKDPNRGNQPAKNYLDGL